jgi:hypothetical protein
MFAQFRVFSTLVEAKQAESAGADAIVAQGSNRADTADRLTGGGGASGSGSVPTIAAGQLAM